MKDLPLLPGVALSLVDLHVDHKGHVRINDGFRIDPNLRTKAEVMIDAHFRAKNKEPFLRTVKTLRKREVLALSEMRFRDALITQFVIQMKERGPLPSDLP